jgi:HSP20 family protein
MDLIPWYQRPALSERLSMSPDFGELFTNALRSFPKLSADPMAAAWVPAIDIRDDDKHVTLTAEIPGVKREDIKIDVNGNQLTLRGEKKYEKTEKKVNYWHREASYGSFMRQITLPVEVDAEHTEAKVHDGVLEVRLPKVTTTKTKSIKVS